MLSVERFKSYMSYYLKNIEQYCMLSSSNTFLGPTALQNVIVKLENLQTKNDRGEDTSCLSQVGSTVRVIDLHDGSVVVFELVMPYESDPQNGRISILSPLGSAVLGKKVGERVDVMLFGYRHSYVIRNVSTV